MKTKSAELIRRAREERQPIIITQNGKATAVLQDVESYERTRKALLLLKLLSKGYRELAEGKGMPHAEVERLAAEKLRELEGE
ncbi:MAG: type II toxin-antitoxin system Phd/YefM family antitoxin [Thermoleophilaceae bacterium]|nr:type II toxin-antitoxin system Phd/YefM family antitoxin [Thermoleophilaceae bacterium]